MSEGNEVSYGSGFLKDVRALPLEAQEKLVKLLDMLRRDAFDARLHTKALSAPLVGRFSFRITRRYRVFFYFKNANMAVFFEIDHRKDIYRNL